MKTVRAVAPYIHHGSINFKTAPYEAWIGIGGKTVCGHYPPRMFHAAAFKWELPVLYKSHKEARLRFVEPVSMSFDTFPDYACYEIIPVIWDCWPGVFGETCQWFERHEVRTAIFTSSQTAERMKRRFPHMNILTITEGIDIEPYHAGKELKDRGVDLLKFGRSQAATILPDDVVVVKPNGLLPYSQLREIMSDSKINIALPQCVTNPDKAGDIETLTQRYWEAMLTRMVMVGHAPKELTDLIGYNPVIEMDMDNVNRQIVDILMHIEEYQPLVDKNRAVALRMASWSIRMRQIMDFLEECGYKVR